MKTSATSSPWGCTHDTANRGSRLRQCTAKEICLRARPSLQHDAAVSPQLPRPASARCCVLLENELDSSAHTASEVGLRQAGTLSSHYFRTRPPSSAFLLFARDNQATVLCSRLNLALSMRKKMI
eukprot:440301-Pleurochrysis_carterae.AAC.1